MDPPKPKVLESSPTSRVDSVGTAENRPLTLKLSMRYGLSPCARQMRPTLDSEIPISRAIVLRDQWVAPAGFDWTPLQPYEFQSTNFRQNLERNLNLIGSAQGADARRCFGVKLTLTILTRLCSPSYYSIGCCTPVRLGCSEVLNCVQNGRLVCMGGCRMACRFAATRGAQTAHFATINLPGQFSLTA